MTRNAGPKLEATAEVEVKTVTGDQATLEANATFEPPAENVRRAVCYNRRCPDYRIERPADKACGCKRTSVT